MKRSPVSLPIELRRIQQQIEGYARGYGLDFFDVIFEMLDWRQINEVAAYGGFPNRYPHWRFGMEYERLSKSYSYGLSKIYEMVINNDPCYAYLLHSNKLVDQKMVMAHVYAHCDFFKNNYYFQSTNRKMMDEMANHKTRVVRYVDRHGVERVEEMIDICLSIDSLISFHTPRVHPPARPAAAGDQENGDRPVVRKIHGKGYMDKFINPPEFLAEERKKIEAELKRAHNFPETPERDVMGFLLEYAPLEAWERDVLSIIREEAYYFSPQGQTKIMNEGWACVTGDTRIVTDSGSIPAREIVERQLPVQVFDGSTWQRVVDWAHFPRRKTVRLTTRRGYALEGSATHQVMVAEEQWKRLDQCRIGDAILVANANDAWPVGYQAITWKPQRRWTLEDVAQEVGVNLSTVIRFRAGTHASRHAARLEPVVAAYEQQLAALPYMGTKRQPIRIPECCDERLARFLGYLIGDGHISRVKRVLGLTTMDDESKDDFTTLGKELFGLSAHIRRDGGRWRVLYHAQDLADFLDVLGLTNGPSARMKDIPEVIWRSPRTVVQEFLKAYFDCDGHAGAQGVILSTFSDALASGVQRLLLQFGILSRRRRSGGGWHVHVSGHGAARYAEQIGFGIARKQQALITYLAAHKQWKRESFIDEVVKIEVGMQDVYDFTVENPHRYVAHGFMNHNSYWHSTMMTKKILNDSEFIDYADHHSGTMAMYPGGPLNPYKIGIELFRDIEERWNKGRFGKEYDDCEDMVKKAKWDLNVGLGRKKIFEVRKLYNDVMFIDEFLTPEFCRQHKLFVYGYNASADQYEILDRSFEKIKRQLLFQLTNFGYPIIGVVDANYNNRGELLLKHFHEGVDLREDYAQETLKALVKIWRRPVGIETLIDGTPKILMFDGKECLVK